MNNELNVTLGSMLLHDKCPNVAVQKDVKSAKEIECSQHFQEDVKSAKEIECS